VTREDDALVYRLTLNTAKADDAAIVGIGVDTDDAQEALVEWPDNARMRSPGLDHFVTAWGDGARVTNFDVPTGQSPEVTTLDGDDVDMDTDRNQMTVRVPDEVVDAPDDDEQWAYVAGTGVNDGSGEFADIVPGPGRSEQSPTSGGAPAGSNVFNLAFRFFEPQQDMPTGLEYDTAPGIGNWFEDEQARKLQAGTTERIDSPGVPPATAQSGDDDRDAAAVVDFGDIGEDENLHESTGCEDDGKGCEQARIMPSRVQEENQFEGVDYERFPHYGGPLQPYLLTIPPGYEGGDDAGLTFSLHSLGGGYTQYKVFSPQQLREFGDDRDNLVVTTLGHGPDGWYTDEAEADFFSAWADVARRFDLDPDEVALTGYSMGGYGTYKLAAEYPDLFGRAFTTVGPPARGSWEPPPTEQGRYPRPSSDEPPGAPSQDTNTHPLLENLRWIPFMNWVAAEDQLVPNDGPRRQQARFDAEGLRSTLWTFQGDHFTLALRDEWEEAREFLQDGNVARDPSRVSYAFLPAADRPELDLEHDHAYSMGRRGRDSSSPLDARARATRAPARRAARSTPVRWPSARVIPTCAGCPATSGPRAPGRRWWRAPTGTASTAGAAATPCTSSSRTSVRR
jgi:pimeloyl-ACP methyl ester carboxylesterase